MIIIILLWPVILPDDSLAACGVLKPPVKHRTKQWTHCRVVCWHHHWIKKNLINACINTQHSTLLPCYSNRLTVIIIIMTLFIVLSLWHRHCKSSLGSCDECRLDVDRQTKSTNSGCRLLPSTLNVGLTTVSNRLYQANKHENTHSSMTESNQ